MTDPDERAAQEPAIDRAVLDAYEVPPVPAGLEDRLWQRMQPARPSRSRRWKLAAGAVAVSGVAAAASVAWWATARPHVAARSGTAKTAERTTLSIDQATLVAEPGSALSWTSGEQGVRVEQRAGNVFYRVERGRPFVVMTAAGELTVLGTCFRVEVTSMKLPKQGLVGGAIGAAITAGVFVAVFEGKVSLANEHGRVEIAAGQSAQITQGDASAGAPTLTSTNVVRFAPGAADRAGSVASPTTATASNATSAAIAAAAASIAANHPDSRFAREARDSQWANAQEQAIQARLENNLGIPPGSVEVECRTRCCRALMPTALYDQHARELQSSVGLGGGEDEQAMLYGEDASRPGVVANDVCFPQGNAAHGPDRGAERQALLAAIRGELAARAQGLTHEVAVSVELTLDDSGAVTKAETHSTPEGEPATACVERAVVGGAAFAPSDHTSWLPVRVTLPLR